MLSEQFSNFTKEILRLKDEVSKSKASKKYESCILNCSAVLAEFGIDNFKRIIKMFLFCIGARRYDFERILYLKIDITKINIDLLKYIINLIHFTGRKRQVKIVLVSKPFDLLLFYKKELLSLKKDITFLLNFDSDIKKFSILSKQLEIYEYLVKNITPLDTCSELLKIDDNIRILYNMENILNSYIHILYSIKIGYYNE